MEPEKNSAANSIRYKPARRQVFDPNYFVWPKPYWMIIILSAIVFLIVSTFSPNSLPAYLGPLSLYGKFMGNNYPNICYFFCVFTVVVHVLEAAYAARTCIQKGMTKTTTFKWVVSTFIFGFPSLLFRLLAYNLDYKCK